MAQHDTHGITVDDILCEAKRYITAFGWQRQAWPQHGAAPRCIRAALWWAATNYDVLSTDAHTGAIRRVSEAIYGRGQVGGINDYEHTRSTNRDSVIALLQKAIEMGPGEHEQRTGPYARGHER